MDLDALHRFSSLNRGSAERSPKAGCFYCLQILQVSEIKEWVRLNWDEASCDGDDAGSGDTALCPHCGVDAVLFDADVPSSKQMLNAMNGHWFRT